MRQVSAGIITGYGINAEQELGFAFERAGAKVKFIHVNDLIAGPEQLLEFSILGFPGGFSFGDHLGSGKVLSHLLKKNLGKTLTQFLDDPSHLVLGVCNGFQTIAKMGLVPNLGAKRDPEVSLINNQSGNFIDRWVQLRTNPNNNSPWLKGIDGMRVPIRHGEGCFVVANDKVEESLIKLNLPAFYYMGENPNGSLLGIAGITDTSGRVLGMMPHPEASNFADQEPGFCRGLSIESGLTDGMRLFMNAVNYCSSML